VTEPRIGRSYDSRSAGAAEQNDGVRRARALLVVVALGVVGAACSDRDSASSDLPTPKPGFCEAAQRYDKRVEKHAKLDEQITIVAKMQRNAPKDIAADAATFLESLEKLADGDESVVDNPKVAKAVENVNRRAINGCEFFKKEPGSGL
jgi:hypothetical protein